MYIHMNSDGTKVKCNIAMIAIAFGTINSPLGGRILHTDPDGVEGARKLFVAEEEVAALQNANLAAREGDVQAAVGDEKPKTVKTLRGRQQQGGERAVGDDGGSTTSETAAVALDEAAGNIGDQGLGDPDSPPA